MKKILFLTGMKSKKYGGLERFICNFIKVCNDEGVSVILQYEEFPESKDYISDLNNLNVDIIVFSLRNNNPLFTVFEFSKILLKFNPEILHLQFLRNYYYHLLPPVARLFGVKKVISMVHSFPRKKNESYFRSKMKATGYNSSDTVVAVSDMVKNELESMGVSKRILKVHYLGIFDVADKLGSLGVLLRKKLGILEDETVLASIAFQDPVKGIDILLMAFRELKTSHANLKLLLIGIEKSNKVFTQLIEELEINTNDVIFAGITDDARQLLNIADIYIQPSLSDALPIAAVEAMSMKVPLVITDMCGITKLLTDDVDAIIVHSDSVTDLRNGILKMLLMKDKWEEITNNSHDIYHKRFNGNKTISSFVKDNYMG